MRGISGFVTVVINMGIEDTTEKWAGNKPHNLYS
jgi:hypothetical protein